MINFRKTYYMFELVYMSKIDFICVLFYLQVFQLMCVCGIVIDFFLDCHSNYVNSVSFKMDVCLCVVMKF